MKIQVGHKGKDLIWNWFTKLNNFLENVADLYKGIPSKLSIKEEAQLLIWDFR